MESPAMTPSAFTLRTHTSNRQRGAKCETFPVSIRNGKSKAPHDALYHPYATIGRTTFPNTSVSLKSRPWKR